MNPEEVPSTKKYFKIGEVSKMLGVPASTLRFWEKDFKQIRPMKNKKGDRIYSLKDLDLLREIQYLTHEKGIRISKATRTVKKTGQVEDSPKIELAKKLRELKTMLLEFKNSID